MVEDKKLIQSNPWHKFTWIEGFTKEIRQFTEEELLSLLDYLENRWRGVTVAVASQGIPSGLGAGRARSPGCGGMTAELSAPSIILRASENGGLISGSDSLAQCTKTF